MERGHSGRGIGAGGGAIGQPNLGGVSAHGAEIGHKVVRIDAAPVLPGKVQGFAALIPDPFLENSQPPLSPLTRAL